MYFIHPNHLHVNLPRDCDDDEICFAGSDEPATECHPTSMSFFLARVRLAQLCREMTDTVPVETENLMRLPYESVIALDQKFEDFLSSLPVFLRADSESREKSRVVEAVFSNVSTMRYCIITAAHSRRCRLHQKFLLRQSSDPRYQYSRRAALASARVVIESYKDFEPGHGNSSAAMSTARMALAVHYTHLALTVMAMDVCFNKDEDDAAARRHEIQEALHMLGRDRHISPLLSRCLDTLHHILCKHGVQFAQLAPLTGDCVLRGDTAFNGPQMNLSEDGLDTFLTNPEQSSGDLNLFIDASHNDIWRLANEPGVEFTPITWDTIFSGLDTRPI